MYAFDAINRGRGEQNWRKMFENFFLPPPTFHLHSLLPKGEGGGELKRDHVPRRRNFSSPFFFLSLSLHLPLLRVESQACR